MRRIYLAARYDYRDQMREYVKQLEAVGFTCVSDWVTGDHDHIAPGEAADIDIDNIELCQQFVIFLDSDMSIPARRGGKHVEAGFAMGRGKDVIVIGDPVDGRYENVFYHHSWYVKHFSTFEQYLEAAKRGNV